MFTYVQIDSRPMSGWNTDCCRRSLVDFCLTAGTHNRSSQPAVCRRAIEFTICCDIFTIMGRRLHYIKYNKILHKNNGVSRFKNNGIRQTDSDRDKRRRLHLIHPSTFYYCTMIPWIWAAGADRQTDQEWGWKKERRWKEQEFVAPTRLTWNLFVSSSSSQQTTRWHYDDDNVNDEVDRRAPSSFSWWRGRKVKPVECFPGHPPPHVMVVFIVIGD